MKFTKLLVILTALAFFAACEPPKGNTVLDSNSNANTLSPNASNINTSATQNLSEVPRPQKISDMMKERGEQDEAAPTLSFVEPKDGATVNSSTVKVKLNLAGDLKGYKPMMDMETKMGNHIHVILDNQPYEAYYNLGQEFELQKRRRRRTHFARFPVAPVARKL